MVFRFAGDTPLTTDDNSLEKVLNQNLPVALYLYDSRQGVDRPLEDTLAKAAKKYAGELLIARVDVAHSPRTHQQYGNLSLPALITLTPASKGRKVKSQAGNVHTADARAHIDYLLGRGQQPIQANQQAPSPAKGSEHVTDANFKRTVLESKQPVLVDFWAPWCGPCHMIAPVIEQMAKEYHGRVHVVKLNVDENPMTAQQYQVQSIPTLIIFKNGRPFKRQVGANPGIIRQLIEEVV